MAAYPASTANLEERLARAVSALERSAQQYATALEEKADMQAQILKLEYRVTTIDAQLQELKKKQEQGQERIGERTVTDLREELRRMHEAKEQAERREREAKEAELKRDRDSHQYWGRYIVVGLVSLLFTGIMLWLGILARK